jgi:hypothetical protein
LITPDYGGRPAVAGITPILCAGAVGRSGCPRPAGGKGEESTAATALVTGASQGFGSGIAAVLSRAP